MTCRLPNDKVAVDLGFAKGRLFWPIKFLCQVNYGNLIEIQTLLTTEINPDSVGAVNRP